MRTFMLYRDENPDVAASGGFVGEGVEWKDGTVTVRQRERTMMFFRSMQELVALHCVDERTRVVWCGTHRDSGS